MFKLRRVENHSILIPLTKTSFPAYFILNETASLMWELYSNGNDKSSALIFLKEKYSQIDSSILVNDINNAFSKFSEIMSHDYEKSLYANSEKDFRKKMSYNKIPIEGALELTFKCNLKCIHCYCVHCHSDKKELNTEEIFNLLDQLAENGCIWLLMTGGEPLLRKDFKEIYLYAKNLGFIITLFSNSLLINHDYARLLSEYPPHLLEISVYGASDETYLSLGGGKNGYTQLINTLDLLDYYDIKYSLKSVIISNNKHDFDDIVKLCESRSNHFRFNTEIMYKLDKTPVQEGVALKAGEAVYIETLDKKYSWSDNSDKRSSFLNEKLFFCEAGNTSFNINPFGEVSLCGRARNPSYSIKDFSFSDIWGKLKIAASRSTPQNFKCTNCSLFDYCKVCPAVVDMDNKQKETEFCSYSIKRKEILS